jgi:hypothetical protein
MIEDIKPAADIIASILVEYQNARSEQHSNVRFIIQ